MPIFLRVVKGPAEALNRQLLMPKAVSTVGSGPAVDIAIPGSAALGVSPLHAMVWIDGRDMIVQALENCSVKVGGQHAIQHRIALNGLFALGDGVEVRFEHVPSAVAKLQATPMVAVTPPVPASTPVSSDPAIQTVIMPKGEGDAAAKPAETPAQPGLRSAGLLAQLRSDSQRRTTAIARKVSDGMPLPAPKKADPAAPSAPDEEASPVAPAPSAAADALLQELKATEAQKAPPAPTQPAEAKVEPKKEEPKPVAAPAEPKPEPKEDSKPSAPVVAPPAAPAMAKAPKPEAKPEAPQVPQAEAKEEKKEEPKPADPKAQPALAEAKPAAPAAKPAASAQAAKPPVPAAAAKPAAPAAAKPPAPPAPVRVLAEAMLEGEALGVEELMEIPIFKGIPINQLQRLPGAIVRRRFKPGEIICREGEFGSTAYVILEGSVDIYLRTTMARVSQKKEVEDHGSFFGLVSQIKTKLIGRRKAAKDEEADSHPSRYLSADASAYLPMGNPVAKLGPGDIFGEQTCLNFYPRSATVRAREGCVVLELLRNVLQVLEKSKGFKEKLQQAYRERALAQHLRSVPILSGLDDSFIAQLRNRVDLVFYEPGQTIFKQGDKADAFYLIRLGTVKVSQQHPGGDLVLAYLGSGELFGEMGLLQSGLRDSTCTALDHVELVKIQKADFDFMLGWFDDIREKFEKSYEERKVAAARMASNPPKMPLEDFLNQGLMHGKSLLLLDLEKCTRCDECVKACADTHDGITRLVREGLRFDKYLVPTSCRCCMDPVCMIGCPVGSIRRKVSMEIIIEDWCIGCKRCANQCPYGNISMHEFPVNEGLIKLKPGAPLLVELVQRKVVDDANPNLLKGTIIAEAPTHLTMEFESGHAQQIPREQIESYERFSTGAKAAPKMKEKAVTCDLCTEYDEPSCVYACPHDAAHRVDARTFFMLGGKELTEYKSG
ncbi:MAG: cyclic nucleotide-binding domain-containing protein [Planctomycetes bacterium]|nr:cyclic nucleotide-binding domain-containing protein [Planctomycetota bacterium]